MKLINLKVFKIISIIIISIILIISAGSALFIYFYPKEKISDLIITNAEAALKRKLVIKNINYSLRGISLEDVAIYEGLTDQDPILAKAEEVTLRFSFLSLLKKKLNFNQISLKKFNINLIFDDNGISNIEKLITQASSGDSSSSVTTKISNIKLNNAIITLKNPPVHLKPLEGTYNADINIHLNIDNNIDISECKIKLPEKRGVVHPDLKIIMDPKNFSITGDVRLDKVSLLWVYLWGNNVTVPYNIVSGNVNNLKITKEAVEGFAHVTSTLTNSKELVFADGYCKVSLTNKTVFLSNIKGKIATSSFLLSALLLTFNGNLQQFKVDNIDAQIADVKPILEFMPVQLFGKAQGNLSYNKGMFNGTLNLKDVGFGLKNNIINGLQTDITVNNNIFKKTNIPLKLYGQPSTLSIASTDSSLKKIFIDLTTSKLIIDSKNDTINAKINLKSPIEIVGKFNIHELNYDNYHFTKAQIGFVLSEQTLTINKLSSDLWGGKVQGNGVISSAVTPQKVTMSLNFNDIKVQDILALNKALSKKFYGSANGKIKLNFDIGEKLFSNLNGKIEFSIDKGKLINTGIQSALGIWLSEFKYKLQDLEFNKIYGNFDINGSDYIINSFIFNSQNLRLVIKGTFNKELIAKPVLIAFEFTEHFIQDLQGPVVLGLRKYLRGDWYTIPFSITGDMTNSKNMKKLH